MQKEWTVSLMLGANYMPRCVFTVHFFWKGASVRVRKISRYVDDLFSCDLNVISTKAFLRGVGFCSARFQDTRQLVLSNFKEGTKYTHTTSVLEH